RTAARGAPSGTGTHRTRNQSENKYARRLVARLALWRANVGKESWLYFDCRAHAGAGHRSEHGDFQCGQCGTAASVAVPGRGATDGVVGAGTQYRAGITVVSEFSRLAGAEPELRADGAFTTRQCEPHGRGGTRAVGCAGGVGEIFLYAWGHAAARAQARARGKTGGSQTRPPHQGQPVGNTVWRRVGE